MNYYYHLKNVNSSFIYKTVLFAHYLTIPQPLVRSFVRSHVLSRVRSLCGASQKAMEFSFVFLVNKKRDVFSCGRFWMMYWYIISIVVLVLVRIWQEKYLYTERCVELSEAIAPFWIDLSRMKVRHTKFCIQKVSIVVIGIMNIKYSLCIRLEKTRCVLATRFFLCLCSISPRSSWLFDAKWRQPYSIYHLVFTANKIHYSPYFITLLLSLCLCLFSAAAAAALRFRNEKSKTKRKIIWYK